MWYSRLYLHACWLHWCGDLQPEGVGLLRHLPGVLFPCHRLHISAGRNWKGAAVCLPASPVSGPELFLCMYHTISDIVNN